MTAPPGSSTRTTPTETWCFAAKCSGNSPVLQPAGPQVQSCSRTECCLPRWPPRLRGFHHAAGLQQRVYANVEFIGDVSLRAPSAPPTRHYTAQPRLRFFAYDGHDGTPGNVAKGMSIARAVARHISTGAAEAWRRGVFARRPWRRNKRTGTASDATALLAVLVATLAPALSSHHPMRGADALSQEKNLKCGKLG